MNIDFRIQSIDFYDYNYNEYQKFNNRWIDNETIYNYTIEKIQSGDEYFYGDQKITNFTGKTGDLRGIYVHDITLNNINRNDNFKNDVDFSYSSFKNSTFKKCLWGAISNYTEFENCIFENCIFTYARWNGCSFKNCQFKGCDFVNNCIFYKCNFANVKFEKYFFNEDFFNNCTFNFNVVLKDIDTYSTRYKKSINYEQIVTHNFSLKNAYKAGHVTNKCREYYYKYCAAKTRYDTSLTVPERFYRLFLECISGYGVKPLRPLILSIVLIVVFAIIFSYSKPISQTLFISASGFLNLGSSNDLAYPYNIGLLIEQFLGFSTLGLYITTLANKWFTNY